MLYKDKLVLHKYDEQMANCLKQQREDEWIAVLSDSVEPSHL